MAESIEWKSPLTFHLERPCNECDGTGGKHNSYTGEFLYCDICDGTGFVLTATGEEVYAFIEHTLMRRKSRSQPSWPFK
jgi:DnaJ-class molecular chaperone